MIKIMGMNATNFFLVLWGPRGIYYFFSSKERHDGYAVCIARVIGSSICMVTFFYHVSYTVVSQLMDLLCFYTPPSSDRKGGRF